jgi:hypothetical protein
METNRDIRLKMYKIARQSSLTSYSSNVINYMTEEGINIMSYPPYSSDLILCNFWLSDTSERSSTN